MSLMSIPPGVDSPRRTWRRRPSWTWGCTTGWDGVDAKCSAAAASTGLLVGNRGTERSWSNRCWLQRGETSPGGTEPGAPCHVAPLYWIFPPPPIRHRANAMDIQPEVGTASHRVAAPTTMETPIKETELEMLELGPCTDAHDLGFQIGRRFSSLIESRVRSDPILRHQLLPFAATQQAQPILQALFNSNREKFPNYWNELVGTAAGSGISLLEILLLNFRKEIIPFIPENVPAASAASNSELDDPSSDCSDVLILDDNIAMVAHNEDANGALIGHTYLVKVALPGGHSFTAYTYAGELPSCAFGFNSHGVAFTLDSVPPLKDEIQVRGIGRNLISRDLLEATSLEDALRRIRSCNISVGHSYNLVDVRTREIANVETASGRVSVRMIGKNPFFHANMYLHLQVQQVQDENSISRHKRAALLSANSEEEILAILGDSEDNTYPIYMRGPKLYTLCTAVIDLDKKMLSIIHGNPKKRVVSHKLPIL